MTVRAVGRRPHRHAQAVNGNSAATLVAVAHAFAEAVTAIPDRRRTLSHDPLHRGLCQRDRRPLIALQFADAALESATTGERVIVG